MDVDARVPFAAIASPKRSTTGDLSDLVANIYGVNSASAVYAALADWLAARFDPGVGAFVIVRANVGGIVRAARGPASALLQDVTVPELMPGGRLNELVVDHDLSRTTLHGAREKVERYGSRSCISAPIALGGSLVASLAVVDTRARRFCNEDQALMRMLSQIASLALLRPDLQTAQEAAPLVHVLEYIANHLSEPLTLGTLATLTPLSRYRFAHVFRTTYGLAPYTFVQKQRLRLGARLLATTMMTVGDIAIEVGFSSPGRFSVKFRQTFGVTPSEYRSQQVTLTRSLRKIVTQQH